MRVARESKRYKANKYRLRYASVIYRLRHGSVQNSDRSEVTKKEAMILPNNTVAYINFA